MKNLLDETINILSENGKTKNDIKWIGNSIKFINWDDFKLIANRKYDDGFGWAEISEELLIVGDDFWLERNEYDGSEWWEFKTIPTKPDIKSNNQEDMIGIIFNHKKEK